MPQVVFDMRALDTGRVFITFCYFYLAFFPFFRQIYLAFFPFFCKIYLAFFLFLRQIYLAFFPFAIPKAKIEITRMRI